MKTQIHLKTFFAVIFFSITQSFFFKLCITRCAISHILVIVRNNLTLKIANKFKANICAQNTKQTYFTVLVQSMFGINLFPVLGEMD